MPHQTTKPVKLLVPQNERQLHQLRTLWLCSSAFTQMVLSWLSWHFVELRYAQRYRNATIMLQQCWRLQDISSKRVPAWCWNCCRQKKSSAKYPRLHLNGTTSGKCRFPYIAWRVWTADCASAFYGHLAQAKSVRFTLQHDSSRLRMSKRMNPRQRHQTYCIHGPDYERKLGRKSGTIGRIKKTTLGWCAKRLDVSFAKASKRSPFRLQAITLVGYSSLLQNTQNSINWVARL